jgi:hypothetical protein
MILFIALLGWTVLFLATLYILWTRVASHLKVYLLIIWNGVFLSTVFWFFPILQEIH